MQQRKVIMLEIKFKLNIHRDIKAKADVRILILPL